MRYLTETIACSTNSPIEIIDITGQIKSTLAASGLRQGQATIISRHTTAFVNINEHEPRLLEDMVTFLKRLVPKDGDYLHNLAPLDGRDNAHSHLMGLFMNASETIPFANGELLLGKWQSVFFVELDGPRPERSVMMQISGT
ncbi:secondary thiamine-phosphate synthase enzyme [Prosthecochloris sp. GSB1]|uniref:secondary thiamine-phosphate synthase enzyme YjbQ n=1 Tax=Prosthecochloris sp. GSB1 TaxID=281093 RepID=UPI000B8CD99F|nr:secondary thiamine-phosphate synthase enzyme YjbQ [Prosthecochloris sp. GSB1]ASQ91588.1 secondary thiamine-phosphate synthase enzyme [Prosthecochloris sp. GSB1]